jgi:hypothetical protein
MDGHAPRMPSRSVSPDDPMLLLLTSEGPDREGRAAAGARAGGLVSYLDFGLDLRADDVY